MYLMYIAIVIDLVEKSIFFVDSGVKFLNHLET